jgi:hypothetical protein
MAGDPGGPQMIPAMMPAYSDEKGGWKVWCPYCGRLHTHAAEPGYRVPPCGYSGGLHTLPRGYFLIPTGQPLPEDAEGLQPRDPITDRREAEGFMTEWTYRSHKSEEERAEIMYHFDQAWAWFAEYKERRGKLRAMNIDPDIFTECLRDVLTFDE